MGNLTDSLSLRKRRFLRALQQNKTQSRLLYLLNVNVETWITEKELEGEIKLKKQRRLISLEEKHEIL